MFFASRGTNLIEYALPLALLLAGGLAVLLTGNIPQAVTQFFMASNNTSPGGGAVTVTPLGSMVETTSNDGRPPTPGKGG